MVHIPGRPYRYVGPTRPFGDPLGTFFGDFPLTAGMHCLYKGVAPVVVLMECFCLNSQQFKISYQDTQALVYTILARNFQSFGHTYTPITKNTQ
ncbi:hypothetical protein VUR80DRAFT_3002 [Thermomyces stellatus]